MEFDAYLKNKSMLDIEDRKTIRAALERIGVKQKEIQNTVYSTFPSGNIMMSSDTATIGMWGVTQNNNNDEEN